MHAIIILLLEVVSWTCTSSCHHPEMSTNKARRHAHVSHILEHGWCDGISTDTSTIRHAIIILLLEVVSWTCTSSCHHPEMSTNKARTHASLTRLARTHASLTRLARTLTSRTVARTFLNTGGAMVFLQTHRRLVMLSSSCELDGQIVMLSSSCYSKL
jgi:hypothetical protein